MRAAGVRYYLLLNADATVTIDDTPTAPSNGNSDGVLDASLPFPLDTGDRIYSARLMRARIR